MPKKSQKKCKKTDPLINSTNDLIFTFILDPNQPEEDTPIRPIVRRSSSRKISVMNEVETNPAKDVRKNIMAELQNAIISKHSFKEKSDEVEENQPDSDPNEEQDEQNEQEDEKEEITNVKDFNEPSQNEVSDSTERDENVSESPKDSPQDSPTQIYQFLNSCVDISIGIFDRQISYKKAIPKELGVLKLTIYRKKSGFGNFSPKYFLFDEFKRVFLLNAKKKVANKTSNYLISLEDNNFSKDID